MVRRKIMALGRSYEHKTHLTPKEMDFLLDAVYVSGEKVIYWKDFGYSSLKTCYESFKAAIHRRKKMLEIMLDTKNELVIIFNPLKKDA